MTQAGPCGRACGVNTPHKVLALEMPGSIVAQHEGHEDPRDDNIAQAKHGKGHLHGFSPMSEPHFKLENHEHTLRFDKRS